MSQVLLNVQQPFGLTFAKAVRVSLFCILTFPPLIFHLGSRLIITREKLSCVNALLHSNSCRLFFLFSFLRLNLEGMLCLQELLHILRAELLTKSIHDLSHLTRY